MNSTRGWNGWGWGGGGSSGWEGPIPKYHDGIVVEWLQGRGPTFLTSMAECDVIFTTHDVHNCLSEWALVIKLAKNMFLH